MQRFIVCAEGAFKQISCLRQRKRVSEQGRGRLVPVKRRTVTRRRDEAVPAPLNAPRRSRRGASRYSHRTAAVSDGLCFFRLNSLQSPKRMNRKERRERKGRNLFLLSLSLSLSLRSLHCYPAKSFQADKIFLATKRHKSHKRNSFLSLLSLFVACIPWSRLGCGSAALCSLRFILFGD